MYQRIFDLIPFIAEKLAAQKQRCFDHRRGVCSYADGKGNHCLVGWLINDDLREDASTVDGGISTLLATMPNALSLRLPDLTRWEHTLLAAFQSYHDEMYFGVGIGYEATIDKNPENLAAEIEKDLRSIYEQRRTHYGV